MHARQLLAIGMLLHALSCSKAESASSSRPEASAPFNKFACGKLGQPLCPAQAWMKTNLGPAATNRDHAAVVQGLLYVAARPPPGMPQWPAIARSGAILANMGDLEAAKAQCRKCHETYRERYRAELRDRPF